MGTSQRVLGPVVLDIPAADHLWRPLPGAPAVGRQKARRAGLGIHHHLAVVEHPGVGHIHMDERLLHRALNDHQFDGSAGTVGHVLLDAPLDIGGVEALHIPLGIDAQTAHDLIHWSHIHPHMSDYVHSASRLHMDHAALPVFRVHIFDHHQSGDLGGDETPPLLH